MQYASSHHPTDRLKYSTLQCEQPTYVLHKHPSSEVRQVIVYTDYGPDVKNQVV